MIDILCRRRKNNPIVVGEAGVGKSALIEGLAIRIVANQVPDQLKGTVLLSLDLGAMQAGASVKGEFEKDSKGSCRKSLMRQCQSFCLLMKRIP
jgi:type VI secretion system protein VasG